MPITINGNGSITGISAGGLPDASITVDDIANGAITPAKLSTGAPTWDTSSRFLVGTSTANNNLRIGELLAVVNTTADYGGACLTSYCGSSNPVLAPVLDFQRSRGTSDGSFSAVGNGDTLGYLNFRGSTGSGFENFAAIVAQVDGAVSGAGDCPGRLVFLTSPDGSSNNTERMRISNNGSTYIRSADDSIYLGTNLGAGTANSLITAGHTATGINTFTVSFRVFTNGNVVNTNNSYGAISDLKLKENIVDAASQWSDIKALQVRKYNFKQGQTHTQIGLIAQEVEQVSPGLVTESPDRDEDGNDLGTVTKSVNYSVLYMKAVKALQEAMERIEQLESKVAALEAQ